MATSRIAGRYEIKELLGQGGMGIVYKAYDSHRKGFVALKTMKDVADPAALELFAQEWRTLANISHPNIVDVLDSGEFEEETQRKPYFVMPLLAGKTLDKLIRDSDHRLTVERTVEILIQTCRGLQAAHAVGLIHRDLKPSNLFVMNDDSVKIINFGMVHLADARKSTTGIMGTLQYMAPEQLEMKDVTQATDIFSLGVVAYEALTSRKPFDRATEAGIAHAIRKEFPPPASDLNSNVTKALAQVVAKALAKGPWNRFESAREFGECLQRAIKREPIELFDVTRIQPRIERARRALNESDFEYANEILNELQLEGYVDSEISLLLEQVNEATRGKVIRQLLDSARTRLQEEEFPLAWQKIQEALQKDPGNREAQALQAEIETRRSDQQMDKWRRLVHQHLHNHAFSQARQAIEEIRKIKPDDIEVGELTAEADRRETEFRKVCDEKEREFQSAMRSYGSGEISTALSKLKKILELESGAPGFIVPGRDEVYRETYNKIQSARDEVLNVIAEIEKTIAAGNIARAAELSSEQSAKYPNDFALQALKRKVEDLQRQEKSAYIAEICRRVDAEPDLDRGVKRLEEALERYPNEPHFQELAASLRKRRDLVNSIVVKARQYEEQNLVSEALSQWNTLGSVYPQYPGLNFEIERVQKRGEQRRREESKLSSVDRIDRLLQAGEHNRAYDSAVEALAESPGDQELQSLKRLALEGRERSSEAVTLMGQAQSLSSSGKFPEAIELLRRAVNLDPNQATVREALANGLVGQAQALLPNDWRTAEPLIQEALRVAPAHALAKSLRPSVLLAKRMEFVDQCVAQARELQAAGDVGAALAKVQEGLATYLNDSRLVQLQNTLRSTIGEQDHLRRNRDLEELRGISKEAEQARDQTSLTALLERSVVLSQLYPEDQEVAGVVSGIRQRVSGGESAKPEGISSPAPVSEPPKQPPAVVGKSANGASKAGTEVPFRKRLTQKLAAMTLAIPLAVEAAKRSIDSVKAIGRRKDVAGEAPRSAASPEIPAGADRVYFMVTSPGCVQPRDVFEVYVWAHLERHRDVVIRRAREELAQPRINIKSKGPVHVVRGTTLSVHLHINKMVVDDAEDMILWEGDVGNATFLVKVPPRADFGIYQGLAIIRANGCQIAKIHFTLRVGRFTFTLSSTTAEVQTHRRAFASYATEDRDEVLARVQGIQKAAPNLEVFLDVLSLRSGKYWEEELKRTIPESDIFYLFWSQYARESSWVEKEWRCALETRGLDFIDPVPLVPPEAAPPPPELQAKHFNDPVLYFFTRRPGSARP